MLPFYQQHIYTLLAVVFIQICYHDLICSSLKLICKFQIMFFICWKLYFFLWLFFQVNSKGLVGQIRYENWRRIFPVFLSINNDFYIEILICLVAYLSYLSRDNFHKIKLWIVVPEDLQIGLGLCGDSKHILPSLCVR